LGDENIHTTSTPIVYGVARQIRAQGDDAIAATTLLNLITSFDFCLVFFSSTTSRHNTSSILYFESHSLDEHINEVAISLNSKTLIQAAAIARAFP
jgi:hypothetical protein